MGCENAIRVGYLFLPAICLGSFVAEDADFFQHYLLDHLLQTLLASSSVMSWIISCKGFWLLPALCLATFPGKFVGLL